MIAEETSKVRRGFEKKVSKLAIIGFVVIIILGGLFLFKMLKPNKNAKVNTTQQTATVARGNIGVTISGSGPIASSNRVDVSPAVNGTVTKVFFKEGDKVKAGDIMFQIDDSNAKTNIENIQSNIQQNQLNQSTSQNDMSQLIVKAPFSGQVSGINAIVGDVLNKGASLCTISDQSKLKLMVPFNSTDIASIKDGLKATVNFQDIMESVSGTVTYVSTASAGGDVYNVEITIKNPGALKAGMKANADIETSKGTVSSTDMGALTITNNQTIKSDLGGTLKNVYVKENQYVKAGDTLFEFDNNDMVISKQTNDLKMQSLNVQLADAQKSLENYTIKAPISGEITVQSTIVGNNVNSGTVISTIADTGHMEFPVSVDELDISKIQVGQPASITVDALTDTTTRPLTGKVSKIAIEGASSNGVTTYPVTIQIDDSTNLKVGMNANADISVSQKNDVLYLPIEAVQKLGTRAIVMVKADPKTAAAARNNLSNSFGGGAARAGGNNGSANNNSGNSSGNNGNANRNGGSNGNTGGNGGNGNGYSRNASGNGSGYSRNAGGNGGNGSGYSRNAGGNNGANGSGTGSGNGQNSSGNYASRRFSSLLTNNPYYADAVPKMVEVGINNDNYIEIISGLSEGDVVILPPVVAATANNNAAKASGLGGLGGLGGGGANRAFVGGGGGGGNYGGGASRSGGGGNNAGSGARSQAGG